MNIKNAVLFSAVALLASTAVYAGGLEPVAAAPVAAVAPVVSGSDFVPAIYLKANAGYADTGINAVDGLEENLGMAKIKSNVSKNNSFAGRLALGYQPFKYLAFEFGYLRAFSKPKTEVVGYYGKHSKLLGSQETTVHAFDLTAKILAPLADTGLSLYALAGPGYLMQDNKSTIDGKKDRDNSRKFDLVYGFGLMYNIDANWAIDAGYTQYCSGKEKFSDPKWQSNVRFYSVGVSYKFNLQ